MSSINLSLISYGSNVIFSTSSLAIISGKNLPLCSYLGSPENSGPVPVPNLPPIYLVVRVVKFLVKIFSP